MSIIIPLRSARAGCLRAVRGVLGWYLRKTARMPRLPLIYLQMNDALRITASFVLKLLPHPQPVVHHRRTPEDLDALVQRQYGWHNATHGNRRRHHHAAQ